MPVDELNAVKDIDKKNEKLKGINTNPVDFLSHPSVQKAINSSPDKNEGLRRAFQDRFSGTGATTEEIDAAHTGIKKDVDTGIHPEDAFESALLKVKRDTLGRNTDNKGQITGKLKSKGFTDASIHTLTNDDTLRGHIVNNQGISGTATLAQLQADEQKALNTNIGATSAANKAKANLDSKTQSQDVIRQQAKVRAEAQAATREQALSTLASKPDSSILSGLDETNQKRVQEELAKRAEQSVTSTIPNANEVRRIELAQRGKRQTPAGKAALDAARQRLAEGNAINSAGREAFINKPSNIQQTISDLGLSKGPAANIPQIQAGRPLPNGRPPINAGVNNKSASGNSNSISLNDNGLGTALKEFSGNSTGLATALNNMPREITMTAKIEPIQVIINGADTLSSLQPMIIQIVNEQINKSFPGKGPITPINKGKNTKNQGIA